MGWPPARGEISQLLTSTDAGRDMRSRRHRRGATERSGARTYASHASWAEAGWLARSSASSWLPAHVQPSEYVMDRDRGYGLQDAQMRRQISPCHRCEREPWPSAGRTASVHGMLQRHHLVLHATCIQILLTIGFRGDGCCADDLFVLWLLVRKK